jgi:hypothetical protein
MAHPYDILNVRLVEPPELLSWGGKCLAEFSFRSGPIVVGAARLLRRPDGTVAMSMGRGTRGTIAADADFKAELMAAALRVYEAKTAPRAPAQPPFATAIIAGNANVTPGNSGAARRHRHRTALNRR